MYLSEIIHTFRLLADQKLLTSYFDTLFGAQHRTALGSASGPLENESSEISVVLLSRGMPARPSGWLDVNVTILKIGSGWLWNHIHH